MKLKSMAKIPKEVKYFLVFVFAYLFLRLTETSFIRMIPFIPSFITGEITYFIKWFPVLIPIFYGLYKTNSNLNKN